MKQKTFFVVLLIVLAICIIVTIAFALYTVKAYQSASLISFIAGELW